MELGSKIKKYREGNNLSQDDLADKVYVSRQTVSNWENNKSYPDINSLKLLSLVFEITLDEFIKDDIPEIKKGINGNDLKQYNTLAALFTIEMLVMLVSAYPLFHFLKIRGFIIWLIILAITFLTSIKIEKIYKRNDCRTYKEIVAFTEGKTLSPKEQIEEKAKRPYQKFLLAIFSGIIAILTFFLLDLILG